MDELVSLVIRVETWRRARVNGLLVSRERELPATRGRKMGRALRFLADRRKRRWLPTRHSRVLGRKIGIFHRSARGERNARTDWRRSQSRSQRISARNRETAGNSVLLVTPRPRLAETIFTSLELQTRQERTVESEQGIAGNLTGIQQLRAILETRLISKPRGIQMFALRQLGPLLKQSIPSRSQRILCFRDRPGSN